jgi:methyl-accepting chemotaxis protein
LSAHLVITLAVAAATDTWLVALAVGLPALAVPFFLYRLSPGSLPTRLAMASAFMIFSALLIQQTRGQIEAHFGIFVLLAFLLYYRDWRPIVVAAALIAVHHLAFNFMQAAGMGVFVLLGGANLPMILVHAAYVVAESAMLIYMAYSLRNQALESAHVAILAERIGAGDLSGEDISAQAREMPLLAQVVEMRQQLKDTLTSVRGSSDKVSKMAVELTEKAEQVDDSMSRQSEATSRVAATIGELTVSIHHLSESAGEAKRMANLSGEASNSGAEVVKATVAEIQNIADSIGTLASDMDRLGGQFDSVANVVGLIKEIADQTNLLALNAAIEAARAGEQGRGFAVVADEVRKLAERTTQATEDISHTIQEIRISKDSALRGINDTVDKASLGVQLASNAGRSIDEIGREVSGVHAMVTSIASGLSEQNTAAAAIAQDIKRISDMAQSGRQAAEATHQDTGGLHRISENLADAVIRFRID